jgi:hypothetical protein
MQSQYSKSAISKCHFTSKHEGHCASLSSDERIRKGEELVLNVKKHQSVFTAQNKVQEVVT